jgi:hypothetical protein
MNKELLPLVGIAVATIIAVWFGISILNPKLIGRADYKECIASAADSGNLTPDLSQVCSHLK